MTEKSLPQPSSPAGPRQARSRTFTPYVLIWATLATLSLFYLVLLATQPTLVARYLGSGTTATAEAEAEATRQALDATAAEVHTLRDTLDQFRSELIEMRAQITSQTDAARDLATRVATLEAEPAEPQRTAKDAKAPAKAKAAVETEPAPAQKAAKKAPAKSEAELETGSVAQPGVGAITFGPPTVTPAAVPPPPTDGLIGVQIATGPSLDSMRLNWTLLSERHAESFRALEPRYTIDMSGATETYNLIVGPLGSVDEARRLCQDLAAKATPCSVGRFAGGAL